MTRIFLALALFWSASSVQAQQLDLGDITKYLNSMRAASASFVQVNPDKTLAQGVLYLSKPGKIRYEYTAPADSLVISDGRVLGVFDKKSNRGAQRYDLKRTPLDILLRNRIDLEAPKSGTITMVFTANPVELRQWIVTDRSRRNTTVILNDLKVLKGANADLFDIRKAEAALKK